MITQVHTRLLVLACVWVGAVCMAAPEGSALLIQPEGKSKESADIWLETSLKRVFPTSPPGFTNLHPLAARNGKISFQACVRNQSIQPLKIQCRVSDAEDLKPQVRWVGLVPMPHFTPQT